MTFDELISEYIALQDAFTNLEIDYKNYRFIVDQVWGNPINEPIPDECKITPELAREIIKNMEKIIKEG
jgi:hypothetical protein